MWMLTFEVQCLCCWWELGRQSRPKWEEHTFHDSVELNVMIIYNGNSSHPACRLIGHYEWWGNYSSTGDMKCWVAVDVQQREVCPSLMKQEICNQKSLSWSLRLLDKDNTCTTVSFETSVIYSMQQFYMIWSSFDNTSFNNTNPQQKYAHSQQQALMQSALNNRPSLHLSRRSMPTAALRHFLHTQMHVRESCR